MKERFSLADIRYHTAENTYNWCIVYFEKGKSEQEVHDGPKSLTWVMMK